MNEQQGFTAADMADQYATAFERGRESVLAEQAAAAQEVVVTYCGRRLTPEGTRECWGYLSDGVEDLPRGTKLYAAPVTVAPGIDLQWLVEGLDEIGSLSCNLRQGGCDAGDLEGVENGLMHAVDMAHQLRDRLLALIDGQAGKNEGTKE